MRLDLNEGDVIVRVCTRVRDIPLHSVAPGSVIKTCDECDVPIWYDPTQPAPTDPKTGESLQETHCICIQCFLMHRDLAEEEPVLLLTDEQKETLEREKEQ